MSTRLRKTQMLHYENPARKLILSKLMTLVGILEGRNRDRAWGNVDEERSGLPTQIAGLDRISSWGPSVQRS